MNKQRKKKKRKKYRASQGRKNIQYILLFRIHEVGFKRTFAIFIAVGYVFCVCHV